MRKVDGFFESEPHIVLILYQVNLLLVIHDE